MIEIKLIDANELRLMKVAECAGHTIEFAAGWKACVEYCKNDAPAIEAEPVKHGHWIDNGICDSMLSACSICGYSCGAYSFNYCPNCGSKQDLGGDSK